MSTRRMEHPKSTWLLALAVLLGCALMPASASAGITCAGNSAPNLVKNGGFETGNLTDWSVGWAGDEDLLVADGGYKGSYSLAIGSEDSVNSVYQNLSTTPGSVYTVCFWLQNGASSGLSSFEALWDDQPLVLLVNGASTDGKFQYFAATVVALGSDELRLQARNLQSYWHVDNVAVQLCTSCTLSPARNVRKQQ